MSNQSAPEPHEMPDPATPAEAEQPQSAPSVLNEGLVEKPEARLQNEAPETDESLLQVEAPRIIDGSTLSDEQIAEMESHSVPAVKRRAPKFKAFFWLGAIVGIVAGWMVGMFSSQPEQINRSVYVTVCVLFTTLITTLIAGAVAIALDKRSVERAEEQKKAIG